MLKVANYDVVTREIPGEISLALNISNCPFRCEGCHSQYLQEDVGEELNYPYLRKLIKSNKGITCVLFMGGDSDALMVVRLAEIVKTLFKDLNLKVAWYSGRETPHKVDYTNFDYVKVGRYDKTKGGLESPTTNQRLYQHNKLFSSSIPVLGSCWRDITSTFWNKRR